MMHYGIRTVAQGVNIVLILVLLAATTSAAVIETRSGERFENVTYTVDSYYKVVKFELAGAKKNLSFNDIKAIYDDQGKDVTVSVLGPYSPPAQEKWQSEQAEVYREGRRKLWNLGFRAASNFTVPAGDYYEGINSGIGFEGDIILPLAREFSLRASVSRAGLKNAGTMINPAIGFHSMRYLLSAQYNVPSQKDNPYAGIFYMYSGLGAIAHTFSYGGVSTSETKFLTELGGGGVLFFTRGVGIDYSVSMGMVMVGSNGYGTTQYGFLFDFKLGMAFWIPSK
ncbi:hypothetical protein C3F09_05230 [candidate division GN15 bacterium]|uniref:Outer membrane protein beta-barrel domain-containing protein n=1 Tax=candidate division GN15 bacterium TaxID=2072418 RepID=A0A855X8C8_9BACT|nr:MAG: hypothetical protein C3F09_05230 [candidate division GN15 bacterium]